jgi:hypothetical protein
MSDKTKTGNHDDPNQGSFDLLLREIEKEPVPERLLELARQLQSALIDQREQCENRVSDPGEVG